MIYFSSGMVIVDQEMLGLSSGHIKFSLVRCLNVWT